jgi:hypothetical protein
MPAYEPDSRSHCLFLGAILQRVSTFSQELPDAPSVVRNASFPVPERSAAAPDPAESLDAGSRDPSKGKFPSGCAKRRLSDQTYIYTAPFHRSEVKCGWPPAVTSISACGTARLRLLAAGTVSSRLGRPLQTAFRQVHGPWLVDPSTIHNPAEAPGFEQDRLVLMKQGDHWNPNMPEFIDVICLRKEARDPTLDDHHHWYSICWTSLPRIHDKAE